MKIVNTQRAITPKVGKPELRFMCSAPRLMLLNICVKFLKNMSSRFKLMEWERKLLTHKREITPKQGKPDLRSLCSVLGFMVFNICAKIHENVSSGFKLMEWTRNNC